MQMFGIDPGMNPDAVRGYIPLSAIWDIPNMIAVGDRDRVRAPALR